MAASGRSACTSRAIGGGLLLRSDALSVALDAYERDSGKEEYIERLREAYQEAHEQFMRYRTEVGITDPPRKPA